MRRRLTWLVTVPLVLVSSQAAHWLAYRLVAGDAYERGHLLEGSGHGYLAFAPTILGGLLALALGALALRALDARRGLVPSRLSALPFGLLPFAAFAIQEHLERLLHDGAFPVAAALEPTFLVGFLLQVPFGMLAYLLARLLLRAADAVGRAFAGERPIFALPGILLPTALAIDRPRVRPLALGYAERGPPSFS